jgi:FtsP/CotA-like multicopper oxidase with cupredoxin domain
MTGHEAAATLRFQPFEECAVLLADVARILLIASGWLSLASAPPPDVMPNDNRVGAGGIVDGVLTVELRAGIGVWRPEGMGGRAITIEAFGETNGRLTAPAPLIRVPEGTEIAASVRNDLPRLLRIHGLCEPGGAACPPLNVPPGEHRVVRFKSGRAGTYHYWATTSGMPQQFRAVNDTQLSGAFVVDPPGADVDDRVFVITEWTSLSTAQLQQVAAAADPGAEFLGLRPDVFFAMNGRIWPHTERLRYQRSESVRWRVINLSTQVHPMHLHGFYFDVDSLGDGRSDRHFTAQEKPRVVTQVMAPGSTMTMTWRPERAGNWLFHCHVMTHVSPTLNVDGSVKPHDSHTAHDHARGGMTGMVLGLTVDERDGEDSWSAQPERARELTLIMQPEPRRFGDEPAYAFSLGGPANAAPRGQVPGPTLVLSRDEPVEITLVNRLPEATAIHWHGMELDSYYDGVHGWGRTGTRVTPMIAPGESFTVRFTPPRSGTFMYHTHLHDGRQLASGLYGAMLVLDPGERFDEATDHVIVLGRGGPQRNAAVVINGRHEPVLVWKAGARHRIRLINITGDDILTVSLWTSAGLVEWTPLTKDGARVPAAHRGVKPARQMIGVGETYDFEFDAPPGRRSLWLEARSPGGKWRAQGQVILQ